MSALTLSSVSSRSSVSPRQPEVSVSKPSALRLTRRGRFVLVGLPLFALLLGLIVGGSFMATQADASTSAAPSVAVVTVEPGESMWEVAQRTNPGTDPREVVAAIVEANGLASSALEPGQELSVPLFK
ncbi:LysM peptidoglycan-binding domain-containing protein [Falsarthrobacter nasiphocae]|uniref:LysM domain-containing protein n=1 Tax=Falsarthrobacter nasiphocae TaxID=189863 RepID=A0AAE3YH93_9MICC|nr:LysM peptidoglycan-binding domain-containing protein [Falsarthrobacter nasiphocae]MDR6892682.1 hypothetical protein [Falsarthrobacter nasiphocae]